MPRFGERSLSSLDTCDHRLVSIAKRAIQVMDFSVYEGHRSHARQQLMFDTGKSKARPGQSKHNSKPSRAMDIAPYPIDWKDLERFYVLAGVIMAAAHEEGIKIRWGGDWDSDGDYHDSSFIDLPHFELVD